MNKANYISDGSVDRQKYPLSVEGLDFMQQQILLAAEMAAAAGNKIIVRGCTEQGSGVTAGIVVINNELLPFVAGTKQTKVRIVERTEHITADFITYNNAKKIRYVEFGANVGDVDTFLWADFKRLKSTQELDAQKATHDEVEELRNLISPKGLIAMWNGKVQEIPSGWVLCDGANGTPDLRGRFIVGQGSGYNTGDTGGKNEVTLTAREMPKHSHFARRVAGNDGSNQNYYYASQRGLESADGSVPSGAEGETGATGASEAHENRPPYYALAYIMKL